jgi:cyclic-di-GMP-binding protein
VPADNSFDIVCKIDMQEVTNALDQTRREVDTRYDLKGSKHEVTLEKTDITLTATDDMKLKAIVDILQSKLHKRGVPLKGLTYGKVETGGGGVLRQKIALQQGIPIEKAREIVRLVKDTKLKLQVSIQEDQVRVSGKSRDDLQKVIALLRERDLGIALQFSNYR